MKNLMNRVVRATRIVASLGNVDIEARLRALETGLWIGRHDAEVILSAVERQPKPKMTLDDALKLVPVRGEKGRFLSKAVREELAHKILQSV